MLEKTEGPIKNCLPFTSTCVLHEHLCSPRFAFFGGVRVQPIFLVFYIVFLVLFVFVLCL
jgi:hypothetical protein